MRAIPEGTSSSLPALASLSISALTLSSFFLCDHRYSKATTDSGSVSRRFRLSCFVAGAETDLNATTMMHADIMLGEGSIDEGDWATGNGWAAGGMIRVLASACFPSLCYAWAIEGLPRLHPGLKHSDEELADVQQFPVPTDGFAELDRRDPQCCRRSSGRSPPHTPLTLDRQIISDQTPFLVSLS